MMDRGVGWLWSSSPRARWTSLAVAAAVTLAFAAMLVAIGVTHAMRFGHDEFIFLGGGYRIYSGQRPHVDFHTPLGLFTPLLIGLAMKIGGPNAAAIDHGTVAFVLVTTAWAYAIGWSRLSPPLAAAYALLVGAIGIGRYTLSFDYLETSVASIFNRYGYAVLLVLLLECTVPVARAVEGRQKLIAQVAGGISSGVAAATLFFIKPSYVMQGAVFLLLSIGMVEKSRGRWIGAVVGAAGAALAFLVMARTNLSAVLADYAVGAAARASDFRSSDPANLFSAMSRRDSFSTTPAKVLEIGRNDLWPFLALLAIAALVPVPVGGVHPKLGGRRGILAIAALVLLSSIPIVFTNWQWGEIPTTGAFAIVLAALARGDAPARGDAKEPPVEPLRLAAVAALAFFSWGELAFKNYGSVVAAWSWHRTYGESPLADSLRLSTEPLRDLTILRSDGYCNVPYASRINEGVALVAKLASVAPGRPHVFAVDFSNPFPIALGLEPPRGDAMWWHFGATFNQDHAWPAEDVLGDVDVVMFPKCAEEAPTRDVMAGMYRPYIDAHFAKADESANWVLLRRREANGQ